jgi:ADP-heptose:LPS heptosyltransferase
LASIYLAYRRARSLAARAGHETAGRALALAARAVPALGRREGRIPTDPEAILLVSLQKIGDAVTVEPAARVLRERFPRARIEVAASASPQLGPDMGACEVFRLVAGVERVHPIRRRRDLVALAGRSDLVVSFGLRARDAWAALRARGGRGIALGYAWAGRGHALDLGVEPPDHVMLPAAEARARGARPEHEFWLELLVRAGLATQEAKERAGPPRLAVSEAARRDAVELLSERGIETPLVVLAPWNAQSHFRWSEERWVELGRTLLERGLARSVAVMGGAAKDETAHASRIAAAIGARASSIAGLFGIERDLAVFERAALAVALDSGPAHLARAVGTPTVVVFGPGSPTVWCPPGARAVQRTSGCVGCRQPRCYQPRRECLLDLATDEVLAAAISLLKRD